MRRWFFLLGIAVALPYLLAAGGPGRDDGQKDYVKILYWLDLGGNDALRKRALECKDKTVVLEGPVETRPAVDTSVSLPLGAPTPVVSVLVPRSLKVTVEKK